MYERHHTLKPRRGAGVEVLGPPSPTTRLQGVSLPQGTTWVTRDSDLLGRREASESIRETWEGECPVSELEMGPQELPLKK